MSEKLCIFCDSDENIRNHHIIPKCKGGKETIPVCFVCENFIHASWSHNELRDTYNSVEAILNSPKFQAFLKWRLKQPATAVFKSSPGKFRDKNKYH
jgi:hypothetical protein